MGSFHFGTLTHPKRFRISLTFWRSFLQHQEKRDKMTCLHFHSSSQDKTTKNKYIHTHFWNQIYKSVIIRKEKKLWQQMQAPWKWNDCQRTKHFLWVIWHIPLLLWTSRLFCTSYVNIIEFWSFSKIIILTI